MPSDIAVKSGGTTRKRLNKHSFHANNSKEHMWHCVDYVSIHSDDDIMSSQGSHREERTNGRSHRGDEERSNGNPHRREDDRTNPRSHVEPYLNSKTRGDLLEDPDPNRQKNQWQDKLATKSHSRGYCGDGQIEMTSKKKTVEEQQICGSNSDDFTTVEEKVPHNRKSLTVIEIENQVETNKKNLATNVEDPLIVETKTTNENGSESKEDFNLFDKKQGGGVDKRVNECRSGLEESRL